MNRLTLNQKLWGIVALRVCLIAIVISIGWATRLRMLQEHKDLLKLQVGIALGVVSHFQQEAADHKLPVDEAKREALATLRQIRWGKDGSGYFGIYDSRNYGVLVPSKPELEGKDETGLVDPNGAHIAVAIVQSSSAGGDGYSSYQWPKTPGTTPVTKLSYSAFVEDWDWHLFTRHLYRRHGCGVLGRALGQPDPDRAERWPDLARAAHADSRRAQASRRRTGVCGRTLQAYCERRPHGGDRAAPWRTRAVCCMRWCRCKAS